MVGMARRVQGSQGDRRSAAREWAASPARDQGAALAYALEPRLLLDAAAAATAAEQAGQEAADTAAREAADRDQGAGAPAHEASSPAAGGAPTTEDLALALSGMLPAAAGASDSRSEAVQAGAEFVFVDAAVADAESLLAGLGAQVRVVMLDAASPALAQIAAALEGQRAVAAVHIVSHGAVGALDFGSGRVSSGNLADQAEALARIGAALSAEGDILLYGCSVAADGAGRAFLEAFAQAAGADVAASSDATGAAARGGDWVLEARHGDVAESPVAQAFAASGYGELLAVPSVTGNGTLPTVSASDQSFAGRALNSIGITVTDPDPGETAAGYAIVGNTADALSSGTWQWSTNGSDWTTIGSAVADSNALVLSVTTQIRFVPADGFTGEERGLTFRALDDIYMGSFSASPGGAVFIDVSSHSGEVSANSGTIGITVTAANQAPVNSVGGARSATEGVATDLSGITVADADGGSLTTTLSVSGATLSVGDGGGSVSGNGSGTLVLRGTAAEINARLAGLRLTPNPGATGTLSLQVSTSDGSASDSDSVTVSVAANRAPTITTNAGATVQSGGSVTIGADLLGSRDPEGVTDFTYRLSAAPAKGSLLLSGSALGAGDSFTSADLAAGRVVYRSASGTAAGSDSFSVTSSDGIRTSAAASFAIEVRQAAASPNATQLAQNGRSTNAPTLQTTVGQNSGPSGPAVSGILLYIAHQTLSLGPGRPGPSSLPPGLENSFFRDAILNRFNRLNQQLDAFGQLNFGSYPGQGLVVGPYGTVSPGSGPDGDAPDGSGGGEPDGTPAGSTTGGAPEGTSGDAGGGGDAAPGSAAPGQSGAAPGPDPALPGAPGLGAELARAAGRAEAEDARLAAAFSSLAAREPGYSEVGAA